MPAVTTHWIAHISALPQACVPGVACGKQFAIHALVQYLSAA